MKQYVLVMGSITHAMRGRDLLRAKGYQAYMQRSSGQIDRLGCSYSLQVKGELEDIQRVLEQGGLHPKQVLVRQR